MEMQVENVWKCRLKMYRDTRLKCMEILKTFFAQHYVLQHFDVVSGYL